MSDEAEEKMPIKQEARRETVAPPRRSATISSCVSICLAAAILTWWLVGDLTPEGHPRDAYMFMFQSDPGVPSRPQLALIVGAGLTLGAASVAYWAASLNARRCSPQFLLLLLPALIGGILLGAIERVVTAGVGGANIGGGFALYLGTPFVLFLLAVNIALLAKPPIR